MKSLIADTLQVWREAERVLVVLPRESPDHDTVALLVDSLRDMHAHLTAAQESSGAAIQANREVLQEARSLLVSVQARCSSLSRI